MIDHKAFPTQEIGSLPKFSWRTKPFRGQTLDERDAVTAHDWGRRLGVKNPDTLIRLLRKHGEFTGAEKKRIVEYSMLYAIAMQENAGEGRGLDLVWSGEQARTEMYETPVSNVGGFEFLGRLRSFDNKYWREASVRKKPTYLKNYHLDEFIYTSRHTARKTKIPVTDAVTIVAWSDHYYYTRRWSKSGLPPAARSFSARREMTLDLARVIRKVLRGLIQRGAREIQLDSPAATQYQTAEDAKLVTEAFNETTRGLNATFSLHSCFPPKYGYGSLFPHILEMKNCSRFSFEYANRDRYGVGLNGESRPGYEDLKLFRDYSYEKELGVGVIHVHTDRLPTVRTVRDRILYAQRTTDLPPEKLFVNPDCGLRTRSPDVAYSMLSLVVAGAEEARRALAAN
jgi:5-methyltetrahydropteroyltriglutamate--homocysteine methyltransferase